VRRVIGAGWAKEAGGRLPATSTGSTAEERRHDSSRRVTVSIVDDAEDIRSFVKLALELDGRFEVVSEAADGREGIDQLGTVVPDLMLIDRNMPRLGGVEALPEIRRRAPNTAVVLYTAGSDPGTYQAALDAGAVDVVDKATLDGSIADHLARILIAHWDRPDSLVDVRIGPLPSAPARQWVRNATQILRALGDHPEVLPEPLPDDVVEAFTGFLETWGALAAETDEFVWVGRAGAAEVRRLVQYWAMADRLSDEVLTSLGCAWSPPAARPFFDALTAGVMEGLRACADTKELAHSLAEQWRHLPAEGR